MNRRVVRSGLMSRTQPGKVWRRLPERKRRAMLALALATAIGVPAGGAFAAGTVAQTSLATVAATPKRNGRPPIPRVSTLGASRMATLISYCWTVQMPGGGESGTCADGNPGHPAHVLRWRPRTKIRVDLRLAAHEVRVQAAQIKRGRFRHVLDVRALPSDPGRRWWTLRLPRLAGRDTDLLISAFFADGDIDADLGIRR